MPRKIWPRLWSLADDHGVLSIVLANLKRSDQAESGGAFAAPAGGDLDASRQILLKRTAVTATIRKQASQIVQAFAGSDLPATIIKGVDFADRLYGDPALRHFGDLDLLVGTSSLRQAEAVLAKLGYASVSSGMKHDAGYGETSFRRDHRTSATVELHWDLVNSPKVRRGVSVRYEDLQLLPPAGEEDCLPKPSPASLLLIACVHAAAGHAFDRLLLVCDICQAARQRAGEIDVDWLRAAIKKTGSGLATSMGLALAGKIFDEPECSRLARLLGLPRALVARLLVTPRIVLRCHKAADSWRRQAFRELLKRPG